MKTTYSVTVDNLDVEQLGDLLAAINEVNRRSPDRPSPPLYPMPLVPEVRVHVPDRYDVELSAIGANKIHVIKAIREITGLGLKEAKDLADKVATAVQIVKRSIPRDEAERAVRILRDAGATARQI